MPGLPMHFVQGLNVGNVVFMCKAYTNRAMPISGRTDQNKAPDQTIKAISEYCPLSRHLPTAKFDITLQGKLHKSNKKVYIVESYHNDINLSIVVQTNCFRL